MAPGRIALLTAAFAVALATPAPAQPASVTYVVLGKEGAVARAIVPVAALGVVPQCPTIVVNGKPQEMKVRARPDGDFLILICEYLLPSGATSASIDGDSLPLPPDTIKSIAVLGDTGCRIKDDDDEDEDAHKNKDKDSKKKPKVQDCNDFTAWPFKPMSKTIAKAKPDLIIHVGDYLYRESACPPDRQKDCQGSPHGDNWATWLADFFGPAEALLKAAPWIVTRGNHEICKRAGIGYARLLDPAPVKETPPACVEMINQYTVTVAGRSFIVLDSSDAADECPNGGCESKPYVEQFSAMKPAPGTWLVTHRPIWGFTYSKNKKTDQRELGIRNMTLQAALEGKWKNVPPDGIELVLSGHIHLWEALSFEDGRTPQFVLGSGGTDLSHKLPDGLKGHKIGGTKIAAIASDHHFGYTIFTPHGDHWRATLNDTSGEAKLACKIEPSEVTCKKP
jgi:Calcineurin-like phosphoesterase